MSAASACSGICRSVTISESVSAFIASPVSSWPMSSCKSCPMRRCSASAIDSNSCCNDFRSEISCMMPVKRWREPSCNSLKARSIGNVDPSLRRPITSRLSEWTWGSSVLRCCSRLSLPPSKSVQGMRILTFRPIIAAAAYPNIRSVAGLQLSINPWSSMVTMASAAVVTMARSRASLRVFSSRSARFRSVMSSMARRTRFGWPSRCGSTGRSRA